MPFPAPLQAREAVLNHKLAEAWHTLQLPWARMDLAGLDVADTPLATHTVR